MKIGLIGRSGSGRSTLFEALTGQSGGARQSGRARLGSAKVKDPRIDQLTQLCRPKRTVYAEISLALPPGGLDVTPLREMRDLRAYAHVVGAFAGESEAEVIAEQVRELSGELVLADMERVETRLARIAKGGESRSGEKAALEKANRLLSREEPLRLESWSEDEITQLDDIGLLSHRPLLTVINAAEERAGAKLPAQAEAVCHAVGSEPLRLCASLEREISELDSESQREFLAAYGLEQPVAQRFAQACLSLLRLICFFTVGSDEVRAWPIPRDTRARRAARAIHSDLEKGFIRAEVIDYGTFVELGSEAKCRAVGKLRTEGKDYQVLDGDIINVRFNV